MYRLKMSTPARRYSFRMFSLGPYPMPMTQPKMMSVNNAANRYDPMPVKSILVWQANTLRPMVMAAVMPAATKMICASEKAQYVASMNPSATVKVDSRM